MSAPKDIYDQTPRPWEELRDSGLLWLINATVFHPRGYALTMHFNDEGMATGWSIQGNGQEFWRFSAKADKAVQSLFEKVRELLP